MSVQAHDPESDENTDAAAFVNGTRIPVGDVDVFLRKEGPLDFTRYCEVQFVSPYKEVDYTDAFDGFDPTAQESWDTIRIDVRDHAMDRFHPAFHGVVTGVGNAAGGGELLFEARAQGPGQILDKIPIDVTYSEASVNQVINDVAKKLETKVPFKVITDISNVGQVREGERPAYINPENEGDPVLLARVTNQVREFLSKGDTVTTPKNFHFGKHTLADVMSWVSGKADIFTWLAPVPSGVIFVVTKQPNNIHHDADYLDGDLTVINNDALAELRPVNTVLVKAPAEKSRDGEEKKASDKYIKAKAVHRPLYRRAGGRELYADNFEPLSNARTKAEAMNEAANKLKKTVDAVRGGDMETMVRGPVTPFDTVEAKPTCDESPATSLNSITYEVNRVHHKIVSEGMATTQLNVGVHTDTEEDIAVFDSWEKSP